METKLPTVGADASDEQRKPVSRKVTQERLSTVEIVSDPGEGAQKCAQIFGSVSAKIAVPRLRAGLMPARVRRAG